MSFPLPLASLLCPSLMTTLSYRRSTPVKIRHRGSEGLPSPERSSASSSLRVRDGLKLDALQRTRLSARHYPPRCQESLDLSLSSRGMSILRLDGCGGYLIGTWSSVFHFSKYYVMSWIQDIKVIVHLIVQIFIVFPCSALTIPRQRQLLQEQKTSDVTRNPPLTERESAKMISDNVYKICTSKDSVSTLLAADPTLSPGEAWKKLYGSLAAGEKDSKAAARNRKDQASPADLQRAFECGNWGPTKPSELFLRVSMTSHEGEKS